jgi:hypothetical protein
MAISVREDIVELYCFVVQNVQNSGILTAGGSGTTSGCCTVLPFTPNAGVIIEGGITDSGNDLAAILPVYSSAVFSACPQTQIISTQCAAGIVSVPAATTLPFSDSGYSNWAEAAVSFSAPASAPVVAAPTTIPLSIVVTIMIVIIIFDLLSILLKGWLFGLMGALTSFIFMGVLGGAIQTISTGATYCLAYDNTGACTNVIQQTYPAYPVFIIIFVLMGVVSFLIFTNYTRSH